MLQRRDLKPWTRTNRALPAGCPVLKKCVVVCGDQVLLLKLSLLDSVRTARAYGPCAVVGCT